MVGATLPLWIPASARMTNSVAGDNYFRPNRLCRLVPAHQGMKIGCIGWSKGQLSSVPRTPPLSGDKPQRYISLLRPSAVVVRATVVGVAGRRRNPSRIGVRDMLSYQRHSQDWCSQA